MTNATTTTASAQQRTAAIAFAIAIAVVAIAAVRLCLCRRCVRVCNGMVDEIHTQIGIECFLPYGIKNVTM